MAFLDVGDPEAGCGHISGKDDQYHGLDPGLAEGAPHPVPEEHHQPHVLVVIRVVGVSRVDSARGEPSETVITFILFQFRKYFELA